MNLESIADKPSMMRESLTRVADTTLNALGHAYCVTVGAMGGLVFSQFWPTYPIEHRKNTPQNSFENAIVGGATVGYTIGTGATIMPIIENPAEPKSYMMLAITAGMVVSRGVILYARKLRDNNGKNFFW